MIMPLFIIGLVESGEWQYRLYLEILKGVAQNKLSGENMQ